MVSASKKYKTSPSAHESQRFTLASPRGYNLSVIHLEPTGAPKKGVVLWLHGYGDYCDHYPENLKTFTDNGYAVCTFDEYGHGKSDGLPGYIPNFDNMVDDAEFVFGEYLKKKTGPLKRFVVGESMGGCIAVSLSLKYPAALDCLILLAPMVKIADKMMPPAFVTWMLRRLAGLFPTAAVVPGPDLLEYCNKNPAMNTEARDNPLTLGAQKPRMRTAVSLLDASLSVQSRLGEVSKPFLLMHGGDDKVTDPEVSKALHEQASSTDKTFVLFEGFWHSLWFEPDGGRERTLATIFDWMKAHL